MGASLDGGEECGGAEGGRDVVHVVPEVHGTRVVHPGQVGRVQMATAVGSEIAELKKVDKKMLNTQTLHIDRILSNRSVGILDGKGAQSN